ncbi:type II secretion system F family protein [Kitasatospora sp. NPDC051853]|uniref:type II secretion system F family protein n=1 Tax=Kitasatospora sp. NPDC051853 TaxID=3364058 RepID=UPI003789747A
MRRELVVPLVFGGLAVATVGAGAVQALRGWAIRRRIRKWQHSTGTRRARRLDGGRLGRALAARGVSRTVLLERVLPVVAGLAAVVLVGGPAGFVAGLLTGLAARRWLPRVRSPSARRAAVEQDRLTRQLPLTAELLAACLGASSSPATAAAAVSESVDEPMSGRLASVASELTLGAPPELCWERLGADCPPLAPLARCLVRTSISGAPPTAPLTGLAHAHRATASRAAHARVRRAGVLATAPLGVCFLPAFVLVGVVPVVMGLTSLFAARA